MRLVMTLLVRDEEELLASHLDFHLRQGVDFVLVTDHQSTDATPEILADYERRGVVRVLHAEGEALDQGTWVTRMARLAATDHGADWVLNSDADEFWWPLSGTLKDMLEVIPDRYGQLEVPRHNFIPRPGEGPFWERMTIREAQSRNLVGGELEPNAIHRAHPDVVVHDGNHWVTGAELVPAPRLPLIEVFHYPVRTWEQFEHKVARAGPGYLALGERGPEVGRDQLIMYDVHRRGELAGYFAESVLDEERVEAGLASGELVVDERLARFMAVTDENESSPGERLAMQRIAGRAFDLVGRAHGLQMELAATQSSLAECEQKLQHTQDFLDEVSERLEELRSSRLVRWTQPLRRAYYRMRGVER